MPANRPIKLRSGGILHGGIPRQPTAPPAAFDSLVRGVVVATYTVDAADHPLRNEQRQPTAIACDVVCYGTLSGGCRYFLLSGCQVMQSFGGVHHGVVYKPRAATRMLDGTPLSDTQPLDVSQMDGDHVAVLCTEGDRNQPIIIGSLPHPSVDVGNSPLLEAGARQQLRVVDGDPLFFKKNGSRFGLGTTGDFVVDTTRATGNGLAPDGGDAEGSPGQGSHLWSIAATACRQTTVGAPGTSVLMERLSADGYVLDAQMHPINYALTCAAGNAFQVQGGGGRTTIRMGNGTSHVAIAEAMRSWWDLVIKPYIDFHVHPQSGPIPGLTDKPVVPSPGFDSSIVSTHVSIPDA